MIKQVMYSLVLYDTQVGPAASVLIGMKDEGREGVKVDRARAHTAVRRASSPGGSLNLMTLSSWEIV